MDVISLTFKNSQDETKKREYILKQDTELATGCLLGRMFPSQ